MEQKKCSLFPLEHPWEQRQNARPDWEEQKEQRQFPTLAALLS